MLATFLSLFVREDFLLFEWKETWFLLLLKIDDNLVVTWRNLMHNLVAVVAWWKRYLLATVGN